VTRTAASPLAPPPATALDAITAERVACTSADQVLAWLESTAQGLTVGEAAARLASRLNVTSR
jgi:hypothetical protein